MPPWLTRLDVPPPSNATERREVSMEEDTEEREEDMLLDVPMPDVRCLREKRRLASARRAAAAAATPPFARVGGFGRPVRSLLVPVCNLHHHVEKLDLDLR